MLENFFPAIVLPNNCYMGDNVLLEPIASALAYSRKSYIVSNWPEMFLGHPHVIGIRSTKEIPRDVLWRSLNLHNAIASTEPGESGEMLVLPDKTKRMYKAAGLSLGRIRAPRLFLTTREKAEAQERKNFFRRPLVGVVIRSRHGVKTWNGVDKFVKKGIKQGWSIFLIDENDSRTYAVSQEMAVFRITNRDIRGLMMSLAMMDIVVGPDTGPTQIAAALGVPTVAILYEVFRDLYENYDTCTPILVPNTPQSTGIKTVAVAKVFHAVQDELRRQLKPKPIYVHKDGKHCIVRIRGLGDVLTSLIALASIKSLDGNGHYTYVSSPAAAKLVKASGLVDEVIGVDYVHATSGLPPLPESVDFTKYDTVTNLINKVDFIEESMTVPRADLFAKEMGLDRIDPENKDWHFDAPASWMARARRMLRAKGLEIGDNYIALQADSEGLSRRWPLARQQEFCGYANKRGYKVVVLSDKEQKKYPSCAINLTGKTSIEEYVGIIAGASCMVGSDSSGMHIAGFMNVPALALFGSVAPELRIGHYDTVFPLVGKGRCVPCNDWQTASCQGRKKVPACMWALSAKRVFSEAKKVMKKCKATAARESMQRSEGNEGNGVLQGFQRS